MSELILVGKHDAHVVLTFNRPRELNALSYALIDALMQCLDEVEADASVRTVVLTGSGHKAFSAGADIKEFTPAIADSPERAYREFVARGQGMTRRIEAFPKPVIAAVNGLAFGGGCEVVEACALAISAEHATFSKPEIRLGFPPPFGGTQRLPRHIGRKRAFDMLLTGDSISATRAYELGLINRVVPASQLLQECIALGERIARHPATAVTATLRAVSRGMNVPIDEALHIEAAQFMIAAASAEARERTRAFVQKRAPAGP